jgi:hypothetical protein
MPMSQEIVSQTRRGENAGVSFQSLPNSPKPQRVCFVLLLARAPRCCGKPDLRNIVSIVILRDLRLNVSTGG